MTGSLRRDLRRIIRTEEGPPPAGAYSQAVVAGGLVHIAGQTPRLADGTRLNDESFEVQARQTFHNVAAIARAAGTDLAHAVTVTIFLNDIDHRTDCDRIWQDFFTEPYPARAVVQSALPGFAIEVVSTCALPGPD